VPPGTQEVRRAALIINYTPKNERKITQRELELAIGKDLESVPDIRYWFLDENGLRAISLVVTGLDSNVVNNVANELAIQMKRIPLIANVNSETSLDRPELRIRPRADLAARLGVSTEGLSETIRVATIGDVGPALAKFDAGDRLIPIRVQLEDSTRSDLQLLQQLRVPFGQDAALGSAVGRRRHQPRPGADQHQPLRPRAACAVAADLVGTSALGDAIKADLRAAGDEEPAEGRAREAESGDAEVMGEVFAGFATAMGAGLMMVYAVLILLFGTLPAADHHPVLAAAVDRRRDLALLVTGNPISMPVVDRHPDADGHRHQERHHAGRFRHRAITRSRACRATRRSSTPAASARGRSS
jgi:multidrug efflux pump subunit AcrB